MAGKKVQAKLLPHLPVTQKRRGRPPKVRPAEAALVGTNGKHDPNVAQPVNMEAKPKKRLGRPPKSAKKGLRNEDGLRIDTSPPERVESDDDTKGSPRTVLIKQGSRRKGEPRRAAGAVLEDSYTRPFQVKKNTSREQLEVSYSELQDSKRVTKKPNKFDDYMVSSLMTKTKGTGSSIDTTETASDLLLKKKKAVDEETILRRLALRGQDGYDSVATSSASIWGDIMVLIDDLVDTLHLTDEEGKQLRRLARLQSPEIEIVYIASSSNGPRFVRNARELLEDQAQRRSS